MISLQFQVCFTIFIEFDHIHSSIKARLERGGTLFLISLLTGLALFCQPLTLSAQNQSTDSLEFSALDLASVTAVYAGSSQNWPIISSLAEYDASTNRFHVSSEHLPDLLAFRTSWQEYEERRSEFVRLVTDGGRVFAAEELPELESLFSVHRESVNDADINRSIELTSQISEKVQEIKALIEERRKVDVEARLETKSGEIDRRNGLIAEWMSASIGELFERFDGIRTGRESVGRLGFVDGSDVILHENTLAIIRRSRIDKLTNRPEVEIELSSGKLLTRLSVSAQNQSEYILNAGNSSSNIESNNFWVESQNEDRFILANYHGKVEVFAEDEEVVLGENEGTVIERGRVPSPPVQLLPAPVLHTTESDTMLYIDRLLISWDDVDNASFYEIDLSRTGTFDSDLVTHRSEQNEFEIPAIPEGLSYIQVRAYDPDGLRGINSKPLQLLRLEDSAPPPIILDNRGHDILYAFEHSYEISGTTEPGATLWVDDNPVVVDRNGRFSVVVNVEDRRTITLNASDAAGNQRTTSQTIQYVNRDELFNLEWSVPVNDNIIERMPRVLVSGAAYEFMQVNVIVDGQRYSRGTGLNGEWALEIETSEATELVIEFAERSSGELIAEKTFYFTQ